MIQTLNATRYITPLREGGSLPAIVETDDGECYVMKFFGAGQGRRALIAELRQRCRRNMPDDVRVATVYYKPSRNVTDLTPDYFVHETSDWLIFPHEINGLTEDEIVNIADWAVFRPYHDYLPYLTAKGGIVTMTKAFARELAPQVRVNAIAPGPITPPLDMSAEEIEESRTGTLVGRWGQPADIAAAVAFLAGPDGAWINGQTLRANGGII